VLSPDNTQIWIIYHATPNYTLTDGFPNRKGRCQLLEYRGQLPFAEPPLPPGMVVPSGSVTQSMAAENVELGQAAMKAMAREKNESAMTKFTLKGKKIWKTVKGIATLQKFKR
jgi:hypothetical protein